MPAINQRFATDLYTHTPIQQVTTPTLPQPPVVNSFMAANGGIPMRGVLPIEQMNDSDLQRFYPYSAYNDRMWSYTYYALYNAR